MAQIAIYDRKSPRSKWKLIAFVLDLKRAKAECRRLAETFEGVRGYQAGYVEGGREFELPASFKGMIVPTSDQEETHGQPA